MMGAVTDATASADSRTFFVDVSGSSLPLGLDTPSYTLMAGMALLLVRALTNSLSFCNMENGFHKHKRRALIK